MTVYRGALKSWADVRARFPGAPEHPDEVIVAGLMAIDNRGPLCIVYRDKGQMFIVIGGASASSDRNSWEPKPIDPFGIMEMDAALREAAEKFYDTRLPQDRVVGTTAFYFGCWLGMLGHVKNWMKTQGEEMGNES